MKILITGAAGFIGSHVTSRLLSQGSDLAGLDNSEIINPEFSFYKIHIRDKDKLAVLFKEKKFAIVIHLAAIGGVRQSFVNPALYAETNITVAEIFK